jgi:hypothetical protein
LNQLLKPLWIGGPGYEEFVAALTDIAYTACEYGARRMLETGVSLDRIHDDEDALRHFIAACHAGFDRAQAAIGQRVIELDAAVREAERELAEARRNRDKDKAQDRALRIEAMTNRQLVLRRIVDYVYFTLLNREAHRYKRFLVHRKIQGVDPDVLRMALSLAETRNREDLLRFTVVADLTTGMHMADLVEIDRTKPEPKLAIIELKTGETNRLLLDMLTKKPDPNAVQQLDAMGPKAWEQLERIMRQHGRLKNAFEVMTTDRGFDALNQAPIMLSKEPVAVDGFLEIVIAVCVEATGTGVSCRLIDECLSLIAIREECGLTITDGLVKHYFYHLDPETRECLLSQGGDVARDEVRRVAESPQFVDLGKFHLRDIYGPGLFATVPTPIALDIVTGKLRLFARFDVVRFFTFAQRQDITLTWGGRKESAEAVRRKVSAPIPGSPCHSAVIHYRVGEQAKGTLFYGFFLRIFRDLMRPGDLVEIIRAHAARSCEEGDIKT